MDEDSNPGAADVAEIAAEPGELVRHCLTSVAYIRNNIDQIVSWFGWRYFRYIQLEQVGWRLKDLAGHLRQGGLRLSELGVTEREYAAWRIRLRLYNLFKPLYRRLQCWKLKFSPSHNQTESHF